MRIYFVYCYQKLYCYVIKFAYSLYRGRGNIILLLFDIIRVNITIKFTLSRKSFTETQYFYFSRNKRPVMYNTVVKLFKFFSNDKTVIKTEIVRKMALDLICFSEHIRATVSSVNKQVYTRIPFLRLGIIRVLKFE